jgi:D-sedoheptulose 7-phosphate isomerase
MEPWPGYLAALSAGLEGLEVTGPGGDALTPTDAFTRWVELTRRVHDSGRWLYFVGNGGSAAIASHIAADACKNGELRAVAFNDPALLTAVSNDVAYSEVFALPLTRLAQRGDLLIAISSSGNSPNILRALEAARAIGMLLVTLSGKRADNRSRSMGDLNFYVPCQRYGWVECAHQLIVHYWFDQYLQVHREGAL